MIKIRKIDLKSCDDSFQPRMINENPGNGIRATRFVRRAGIERGQKLMSRINLVNVSVVILVLIAIGYIGYKQRTGGGDFKQMYGTFQISRPVEKKMNSPVI